MTTEYFGSFIENVKPKDVFVAATVDQEGNVVSACKKLGIETLLCRAHRINSAVMWMLGIAGSANTCQNPEMREIIQKAAALVVLFSHSSVNYDTLRDIQRDMQEKTVTELENLIADAEAMGLAQGEAEAGAALGGFWDCDMVKFDIVNLLRRNDMR